MYVCTQMAILLTKMMYVTICEQSHIAYFKNKKNIHFLANLNFSM